MARYIYKPLLIENINTTSTRKEFFEKYKESLQHGEILIDLYNYDIYSTNRGLEYPTPITSEVRQNILEWIESDDSPVSRIQDENIGLIVESDNIYPSINAKRRYIEQLMDDLESSTDIEGNIESLYNSYLRIDREVEYFYTNLYEYAMNVSEPTKSSAKVDINKILLTLNGRFIDLMVKYDSVTRRINSQTAIISKYVKVDSTVSDEVNEFNLIDKIKDYADSTFNENNYLFTYEETEVERINDLLDNTSDLIVEANAKMDKSIADEDIDLELNISMDISNLTGSFGSSTNTIGNFNSSITKYEDALLLDKNISLDTTNNKITYSIKNK